MFSSKRLFDPSIEPACIYCENGSPSIDKATVLCVKKGVVSPSYRCSRFIYDPTKREPKRAPTLPGYSPEDFAL